VTAGAAVLLIWLGGCASPEPSAEAPPPATPSQTATPAPATPAPTPPPEVEAPPPPFAMAGSEPLLVRIPAIGVRSRVMDLGLDKRGQLEVPPGAFPAGWYTGAPTPGELGPAIIAGHVRWGPQPGVFAGLGRLAPGDEILVTRDDDSTAIFQVTEVAQFDKERFPTKRVYGNIGHAGLRLITCGGLDRERSLFEDNVVVFAELVRARTV
jgi:hypothetical protein